MMGFLFSGIMRWVSGGLIVAVIAGSLYLWHKNTYVHRVELQQWQEYTTNLQKAYQKREQILKQFEQEKLRDDAIIEKMEKEATDALSKESRGDDPVVLDADGVERLRDYSK